MSCFLCLHWCALCAQLMKKPASGKRPSFSEKPTAYKGGKLNFKKSSRALRVYLRTTDKVEMTVSVGQMTESNKKTAYSYACALIEADKRPRT